MLEASPSLAGDVVRAGGLLLNSTK